MRSVPRRPDHLLKHNRRPLGTREPGSRTTYHVLNQAQIQQMQNRTNNYLSHIIDNGTIRPSPRKTDALFNVNQTTVNQVHKMLGLAASYKKFIRGFAEIVKPLREVIQECNPKNMKNLTWNKERQDTFDKIRNLLASEPILRLPRMNEPFQVETDASDYGCGGIQTQGHEGSWHPVAYFSQSFTGAQKRYSTSEKELYAIVLSCEYFRQFLYGLHHFRVITDHRPLQYLLTNKDPAARLARWLTRLDQFTGMEITYRKGSLNTAADAMSRICDEHTQQANEQDNGPIHI
jgi:hypothetical protein